MDFLYKDELDKIESCPPSIYKSMECECFRWVYDEIDNENNFKSQADKNPSRLNSVGDKMKCDLYALSLHKTIEDSKKHFEIITKSMNSLTKKKLGTKIAKGKVVKTDGVGEDADSIGHFNFHPIRNNNFKNIFVIVDTL